MAARGSATLFRARTAKKEILVYKLGSRADRGTVLIVLDESAPEGVGGG